MLQNFKNKKLIQVYDLMVTAPWLIILVGTGYGTHKIYTEHQKKKAAEKTSPELPPEQ